MRDLANWVAAKRKDKVPINALRRQWWIFNLWKSVYTDQTNYQFDFKIGRSSFSFLLRRYF